jgi:hypothetical protein
LSALGGAIFDFVLRWLLFSTGSAAGLKSFTQHRDALAEDQIRKKFRQ